MNSKKRKEKRQIITLAIVFASVIALAAVYFAVRGAVGGEQAETSEGGDLSGLSGWQDGTYTAISEDYKLMTKLSYTYDGETLSLYTSGEDWKLEGDEKFPVDTEKIIMMSQAISDFGGFRRIRYDSANKSAYGFDAPQLTVTATYLNSSASTDETDSHTVTSYVGKRNDVTGYYYFMTEGSSYAYMVSDALFEYFAYKKDGIFRNTSTPTPNASDINALSAESASGVYEYDAETDGKLEGGSDHPALKISSALPRGAMFSLDTAVEYGADAAGLARYGLDDPAVNVAMTYTEYVEAPTSDGGSTARLPRYVSFELSFGDTFEEDGVEYVYVTSGDSGIVYKTPASALHEIEDIISGEAAS